MAIDTRNKRASALREGLLPLPDGAAFDGGDRQQILWQYRGIGAEPPPAFTAGDINIVMDQGNEMNVGYSISMI